MGGHDHDQDGVPVLSQISPRSKFNRPGRGKRPRVKTTSSPAALNLAAGIRAIMDGNAELAMTRLERAADGNAEAAFLAGLVADDRRLGAAPSARMGPRSAALYEQAAKRGHVGAMICMGRHAAAAAAGSPVGLFNSTLTDVALDPAARLANMRRIVHLVTPDASRSDRTAQAMAGRFDWVVCSSEHWSRTYGESLAHGAGAAVMGHVLGPATLARDLVGLARLALPQEGKV